MKILIVLTSHSELGNTGEKTGFWVEEFAAPYYVLSDAGATITLASPKEGSRPSTRKAHNPIFRRRLPKSILKISICWRK